jgi:hypothetical protein
MLNTSGIGVVVDVTVGRGVAVEVAVATGRGVEVALGRGGAQEIRSRLRPILSSVEGPRRLTNSFFMN